MERDKELKRLQDELDELQAKYDFLMAAVDHLPNPTFMKDEDGRFFFFNRAYADFFKMRRRDYIGKTVLDMDYLPVEDRERFQQDAIKLIDDVDIIMYDANFKTDEGTDRPSFYWSCGFIEEYSGKHGLVGEIVDISKERDLQHSLDKSIEELKISNEKLQVMAETDPASGLFNRTVMWNKGKALVELCRKNKTQVCMIMFDLDHFKRINDEFGHLKGDEILLTFADILRRECRKTDIPIRYGGDEFLLILQNIALGNANIVAERIRSRAESELKLPDGSNITTSIGIVEIDGNLDFEKNLSKLDEYLYRAKSEGRNRIISE